MPQGYSHVMTDHLSRVPADQADQDEFDPSELARTPGLQGYLARAADWRARLDSSTGPLALPPATESVPLLVLPPELSGVGQLAVALTAQAERPLRLATAPLLLAQRPTSALYWIDQDKLPIHQDPDQTTALLPYLTQQSTTHLELDGDTHPVTALCTILHGVGLLRLLPDAESAPSAAGVYLARCLPLTPVPANPAKQIALRIHQRLPILVGDGMERAILRDWAMRLHWRAQCIAWDLSGPDLARTGVLARLPRYWPNSACYVSLAGAPPSADTQVTQAALELLRRRRFPVHSVSLPDGLHSAQRAWLSLELGEWVALYVAWLNNADPSVRVPHTILFSA